MDSVNPDTLVALVAEYAPRVVLFFVVLIFGYVVAGWCKRLVVRSLTRARFDATLTKFFGGLTRTLILVLTLIALLGYLGIATASFAAVIAAAGLAIGLAFQGTLSNFAAGVMLLIFRPFKVGDVVTVAGETGVIDAIDLFVTTMDTLGNRRVIIGNSNVFGSTIVNSTYHPTRRVDISVGTDYGADLAEVRRVLETVPGKVEGVLSEPPPQIFLSQLGGSSIDWQVRVWCKTPDYWDVWQRTTHATKVALDEAGIGIPFPQMDVHLDGKLDG